MTNLCGFGGPTIGLYGLRSRDSRLRFDANQEDTWDMLPGTPGSGAPQRGGPLLQPDQHLLPLAGRNAATLDIA